MSKPLMLSLVVLASGGVRAEAPGSGPLDPAGLERVNVAAESVPYRGKSAVRLVEAPGAGQSGETLAIVAGTAFRDGTIEVELAGTPRPGSEAGGARGFVGVAFRLRKDPLRYECFYLRPTNGRADDQLRRNHSTQYVSHPEYPWDRLRKESPGVYESYVDLVPGEWTRVRIDVAGTAARLYVHGAEQPALVVNDLKLGASKGALALWIGPGTEAHFSGLRINPLRK
jgi:hypothetical protein